MSIDLKQYQVRVEQVLVEKKRVDEAREFNRGGDLDWLHLGDGEEAMVRIIPQKGSDGGGRIAKEVHRYRRLQPKKFISPYHHAGVEDPYHQIKEYLQSLCRKYREKFDNQFGKKSSEYETIVEFTKKIWGDSIKLSDSVEHYLLVLNYPNPQDLNAYAGPMILKMSSQTYSKLLGIIASPFYSTQPLLDFEVGRRIHIKREGKDLDTTYSLSVEPDISPFPKDKDGNFRADILEKCPDLDTIFKPSSVDEMKKFLNEQGMYELVKVVPQKLEELYQSCLQQTPPKATEEEPPTFGQKTETPSSNVVSMQQTPQPQALATPPVNSPILKPETFDAEKANPAPTATTTPNPPSQVETKKEASNPSSSPDLDDLLKGFEKDIEELKKNV